jgi:hypothetical protein
MGCMTISEFKDILDGLLVRREDVTLEEAESYTSIAVTAKNLQNCIVIPTEKDILDIYKASFNL